MSAHHKTRIKEVVILVTFFVVTLRFLKLEAILTFLIDLSYYVDSERELELTLHTFSKTQHIIIDNMTLPGISVHEARIALKEVGLSERHITDVVKDTVKPY